MKKKVLNTILIAMIIAIYGMIFGIQFDLFDEDKKVTNISEPANKKDLTGSSLMKTDFNHKRNYFMPLVKIGGSTLRSKSTKPENRTLAKVKAKIDTLAVVSSGKNAKYLLKTGDKIWIN